VTADSGALDSLQRAQRHNCCAAHRPDPATSGPDRTACGDSLYL